LTEKISLKFKVMY